MACHTEKQLEVTVYETSASGAKLEQRTEFTKSESAGVLRIFPEKKFQIITGFGGSFTESSAHLLNGLSPTKRKEVLDAYFSDEGARYSLTRTHMNSCDFSLSQYSYAPIADDPLLEHFSVEKDKDAIIPMIQDAMAASTDGFKIISSPWTAPPWMKDNNRYVGGKLLPKYYDTWALFFSKYLTAYQKEGIDIWGFTVENEPLGNGNNWESMHYTPEEMNDFVIHHLGPKLDADKHDAKILGYDQNRGEELKEWIDAMYENEESTKYFAGTAVHWYNSTYDYFGESLQYAHHAAPDKYIINTEACVDSEIPKWQDDQWYWSKEATDWGWDWAPEKDKYLHPKYAPVNRYARDIIGCLNNWVDGWIDWNMVLDKQGGPNWFENWCVAPVLVDIETDEVYYTPIYYTMAHFSKFIRPGAVIIGLEIDDKTLQATAAQNPDGSIALVVFNEDNTTKNFTVELNESTKSITIEPQAIQTLVIHN
ncbi:MAG: glucosylceramidase [Bacteroidia bacterium]|jgi:glucosylceramidase|tara:strand:+ start:621 stop:2060 length:1440 start_codon:yes stop_codon:yes gene_type:complete